MSKVSPIATTQPAARVGRCTTLAPPAWPCRDPNRVQRPYPYPTGSELEIPNGR